MELRMNLYPPMRAQCRSVVLRDQLWLFGGMGAGATNAVWWLDLNDCCWHPHAHKPGRVPSPRTQHSICSDGISRFFIFGGTGEMESGLDMLRTTNNHQNQTLRIRALGKRHVLNDLYQFDVDFGTWKLLQVAGASPSPRRGHSACMLVNKCLRKEMVPVDPEESASPQSGPAQLMNRSFKTSESRSPKSPTLKRPPSNLTFQNSMKNDEERQMFSESLRSYSSTLGSDPDNGRASPGKDEAVEGIKPMLMKAVMMPHTQYDIVIIGGAGPESVKGVEVIYPETWVYSLDENTWTQPVLTGCVPPARFDHTATLVGKNIFIIGGLTYLQGTAQSPEEGEAERDVLVLDTEQWVWSVLQVNILGMRPPALFGHASIEDPYSPGKILVFGGRGSDEWTNDLWSLNTLKGIWSRSPTGILENGPNDITQKPQCRYGHVLVAWDTNWKEKLHEAELAAETQAQAGTKNARAKKSSKFSRGPTDGAAPAEEKVVNTKIVLFGGYLLEQGKGYSNGDTFFLLDEATSMINRLNTNPRGRQSTINPTSLEEAKKLQFLQARIKSMTSDHEEDSNFDGLHSEFDSPGIQNLDYVDQAVWNKFFSKKQQQQTMASTFSSSRKFNQHLKKGESIASWNGETGDAEIPSTYADMKDFLLGIRPDKRTSKINPRDKRTATSSSSGQLESSLNVSKSLPALKDPKASHMKGARSSKRPQTTSQVDIIRW